MAASDSQDALRGERGRRRRLLELAETRRWVHHAGDLGTGEIVTTPLDRPITPLSRAERLSQLGHQVDPLIFGSPVQRLTPRHLYEPSPLAYLVAVRPNEYFPFGGIGEGNIWWDLPRDFDPSPTPYEPAGPYSMEFHFDVAPAEACVVSLWLAGYTFEGTQGRISFKAFAPPFQSVGQLSVPIHWEWAAHTLDFSFVAGDPPQPVAIYMTFEPGISLVGFGEISLAQEFVIHPEPPIAWG